MIKFFTKIPDFRKELKEEDIDIPIGSILNLDFPFVENRKNFTVITVPDYSSEDSENVVVMAKDRVLVFSGKDLNPAGKNFRDAIRKKHGESTIVTFLLLKNVVKNYSKEFENIRGIMNELDVKPILEEIEKSGKQLRRLTDRMEELVQLIMKLKERDIEYFEPLLISFDYEILQSEARYLLERCRSHIYRIASLRTKSEMESNRELNAKITRLTVIMTFLTIINIVVNVPGTIGAIFGIPALSDAYFKQNTSLLVLSLIIATFLSMVLGWIYWKSLKLTH